MVDQMKKTAGDMKDVLLADLMGFIIAVGKDRQLKWIKHGTMTPINKDINQDYSLFQLCPHVVRIEQPRTINDEYKLLDDMIWFVIEELSGRWVRTGMVFNFALVEDAMAFKLRWS